MKGVLSFVLVHGAWGGAFLWRRVERYLLAAGYAVFTPTLTGLGERSHLATPDVGLGTHVLDVLNALRFEDLESVILVGHSYAGRVITGVAELAPERVARLVYVDAAMPRSGESTYDAVPELAEQIEEEAAKGGDGWRWPLPSAEEMREWLSFEGIDPDVEAWMRQKAVPMPIRPYRQALRLESTKAQTIPRTIVTCMAGRESVLDDEPRRSTPGWELHEIPTGHWPMLSTPRELAEILLACAANAEQS